MKSLSILYVGVDSGTCRHRALALRRLGHRVTNVDPRPALPQSGFLNRWIHHTGALGLSEFVRRYVLRQVHDQSFDIAYVDGGELVSPALLKDLKPHCGVLVSYNSDDPFGTRDGGKWRLYLQSLPLYDLAVVFRECNVQEALDAGARKALRVYGAADEVAHAPRVLAESEREKWASDVVFVGTWMPERSPFFAELVQLGVPLTIYGDRWQKAKEWPVLSPHWKGPGLYMDDDYARAILGAKVCLGLLSKGNRDLSTTRSVEIPHLGGVLCAERTTEHLSLYREGEEAVFWSNPEECAEVCMRLLANEELRRRVALNGRRRCLQNRITNESVMNQILASALNTNHSGVLPDNCLTSV
jgi:spore maturation protein CgeB